MALIGYARVSSVGTVENYRPLEAEITSDGKLTHLKKLFVGDDISI